VDIIVYPGAACSPALREVLYELNSIDMKSKLKTPERYSLWKRFANLMKNSFPGMQLRVGGKDSPFYEPKWIYLVLYASYKNIFPVKDNMLLTPHIVMELSTGKDEPLEPIPLRLNSFIHNYLEKKKKVFINSKETYLRCYVRIQ